MKKQLTKTRFNASLGIARHLFGGAASLGAVILICHSAAAQDLYVSARSDSGGKVLRYTWDGMQSIFAEELSDPQGLAMDSAGNLFVADVVGDDPVISLIYKFSPDGVRSTFATCRVCQRTWPLMPRVICSWRITAGAASMNTSRADPEPSLPPD